MASSPSWHRRRRRLRSKAKRKLREPSKGYTQQPFEKDLLRLETHHTKPLLLRASCVMAEWHSSTTKWKGQYWGNRRPRGKKQQEGGAENKDKKTKKSNGSFFPTYDSMPVDPEDGPSSSSSSSLILCGNRHSAV